MAKTVIDGAQTLKGYAGKELGTSEWRTLAYEDIVKFAEATGDFQWIHIDRERCKKESPFGAPIAHGYYSVSRIAGLFFEVCEVKGFALTVNYGLNKVRFPAPLKEGARYRLAMKMNEVKDIPGGLEGTFIATIEVEGSPKPACVAEAVYRFMQG